MPKSNANSAADPTIMRKYYKLYDSLTELVATIQATEPAGVLTEDMAIKHSPSGIQLAYLATPVQLTVTTNERTFILKVIDKPQRGSNRSA